MRVGCPTQHTPDGLPDREWMEHRLAKVTGSNMAKAMSKLKRASNGRKAGDWSREHDTYVSQIAWEIITGKPTEHYVSSSMMKGTLYEPDARFAYSDSRWGSPIAVEMTGFVYHPTLNYLGASPDGITPDGGILEIKVPETESDYSKHRQYIEEDVIPEDYLPQIYCEMLCCDFAAYADFVSYCPPEADPFMPDEFRLFVKRTTDEDDRRFSEWLGLKEPATRRQIWDLMEEAATITMEQATALAKTLRERYPAIERKAPIHVPESAQQAYDAAMAVLDQQEMVP